MRHNWIPTVLRARQAQEDVVAQGLAVARRDADRAADQHAEQSARVDEMAVPHSQTVRAFHATLSAQQAAVASLAVRTTASLALARPGAAAGGSTGTALPSRAGAPDCAATLAEAQHGQPDGADVVSSAEKYLGVPYVFGGSTPAGLDCSGLVQR